ncbi:hypothetical protein [Cohaesibacter celericrescens]|uniref:Uncharacterized protein n=1 Tax=Cohaesibacter celericrescens TaxID=2067669 RepID=A0A2N5XKF9_9HYPH|nr:hypothetical protein [Cohaesibacter celericrescens]PLW75001.1 hypothetical protein C0081_22120 [Cohaesibacter celericrescens]
MKGTVLALVSCLASIACYFVQEPTVAFAMVAAFLLALYAAWRRGRPVLLLAAYILSMVSFASLPQGLYALLRLNDIDPSQFTIQHQITIVLTGTAFVGILFALSCRRQSGGVPLSAQEASEDLEKLVCFVGRATGLLYIPLFCLPLYLAFTQSSQVGTNDLDLLSWSRQAALVEHPQIQIFSWLFILLMLGGLASAYMRNAHHRYLGWRAKAGSGPRAVLELMGAAVLLLPVCWIMMDLGWAYSHQIQFHPAASVHIKQLMAAGHVPAWGLYAVLPFAFALLACAAISVILRSLVYLFGPNYLRKRAATHLDLATEQHTSRSENLQRNWGDQIQA